MPRGIYARTPAHRHIKPVAAYIREGVTNPAVIHALDNLQVLTPRENLTKSDKFPLLQVPA